MYVPSPGRCVVSPAAGKVISLGDSRVQRNEVGLEGKLKKYFQSVQIVVCNVFLQMFKYFH